MRYWWVNQNRTYAEEVSGCFLWSPKSKSDGSRNPFYETMLRVEPGDVVFSFCDTRIKAISRVASKAQTSPQPDFANAGVNWDNEGWLVPADYITFENPIRPKDHIDALRPFLPVRYSPLRETGDGLQGVYLTEVPELLAVALIDLIGQPYFDALAALTEFPNTPDPEEPDDPLTPAESVSTSREQVIKARRGQGLFRANVLLVERSCRVTGVDERRHLRASHIKPWRDANNEERLSRNNGLLLSPHVDHLFDQGYISLSTTEQLLVVPDVRHNLLTKWGIDAGARVGEFNQEQQAFLDYHRANVFRGDRS